MFSLFLPFLGLPSLSHVIFFLFLHYFYLSKCLQICNELSVLDDFHDVSDQPMHRLSPADLLKPLPSQDLSFIL